MIIFMVVPVVRMSSMRRKDGGEGAGRVRAGGPGRGEMEAAGRDGAGKYRVSI